MTNEELFEEIEKLREEFGGFREELRSYIRRNENDNEVISNASEQEIDSAIDNVVYGNVQANPNEPKEIVLSGIPKVDDKIIKGTDEDRYYKEQDNKIVNEFLEKNREEKVEEQEEKVEKDDRSGYIPGTDILKPRDRYLDESDEDYIKFLEEFYAEKFPKGLAVVNNAEKGLATLDDVKQPGVINEIEDKLNNPRKTDEDLYEDIDASQDKKVKTNKDDFSQIEKIFDIKPEDVDRIKNNKSRDIYSNSDGTSESIAPQLEQEKKKQELDNEKSSKKEGEAVELPFGSDEEKEAFEKAQNEVQNMDYKKDDGSKTKKVGKIRKAIGKFKNALKKHGKKIIAGVLVAATAIGTALAIKSCTYDKKDDLNENKDNLKSNTDEYDSTIPSVAIANSFGAEYEDIFGPRGPKDESVKSDDIIDKISDNKTDVRQNEEYQTSNDTFDVKPLDIGDPVDFNGSALYENSYNAANNIDPLNPYYSNNDKREISAIHLIGPNGEQETVTTRGEAKQYIDNGWRIQSVNMKNNTRSNDTYVLKYEGWANLDDVSKVK